MSDGYEIKDSGARQEFEGGMVRDTEDDKVDYSNVAFGPMFYRWAMHCTKGRIKYPDPQPGVPNWTLAKGVKEFLRFRASAFRHFMAWFMGLQDEDHAAGVFFNINGAEYVKSNMWSDKTGMVPPGPAMKPNYGLPSDGPSISDVSRGIPVVTDPLLPPGTSLLVDKGAFQILQRAPLFGCESGPSDEPDAKIVTSSDGPGPGDGEHYKPSWMNERNCAGLRNRGTS